MQNKRLQYNISSWSQATKCLSNNCKNLYITVDKILHNKEFEGEVIKVNHPNFGVLFSAVTHGSGTIVSDTDETGFQLSWLETSQILEQLEKFGFDITYREDIHLPGDQLTLLSTLLELGYDKIRKIEVKEGERVTNSHVIAFDSTKIPELLTLGMKLTSQKFQKLCADGCIMNVDNISDPKFSWSWLIYAYNISDILDANSEVYIPEKPQCPVKDYEPEVPIGLEDMNEGLHVYEPEDTEDAEDGETSEDADDSAETEVNNAE